MNNVNQLSSLLVFAEVARQRSFTQAAEQLDMSKSAISQHLKRLEAHIGQQLLSRSTRGMSLTASGEKLFNRCELLRSQVDLALEELDQNKETPSGRFSLTIPHSFEKDIAVPALSQLCMEFPKIEPDIQVTDEPLDLIKHKLDVALYGGKLKDSNYRALPIGKAKEIFCATPAYVKKHGQLKEPDDLLRHRFIATFWQKGPLAIYQSQVLTEKVTASITHAARSNALPSTLELVLHDMGVALLPEFVLSSALADGRLIRVLPDYQGKQWPFYLVHRYQGEKPIHVTRFYQLIKHYFAKVNVE